MATSIFALLVLLTSVASVTNSGGDGGAGEQKTESLQPKFSIMLGPLYPRGGKGVTENISAAGIKYTMAIKDPTEYTLIGGNEKGHSFYMGMVSIKNEIQAVNGVGLLPYFYYGLQGVHYHGADTDGTPFEFETGAGFHLGFGIDIKINRFLSLRNDYTFAVGPGKILFAALAFQYSF